jgi:5-methylcytosine-specific restriction protein B
MTAAELVREYCRVQIVASARARGDATVSIRAGDVHTVLDLKDRMPLVCAAIGANIFEEVAGVERVSLEGPVHGANAVFTRLR